MDVRLVDVHTHTQPTAAATAQFFARLGMGTPDPLSGTVDELLAIMDRAGIRCTTIVPWLPAQDLVARAVEAGADRDEAVSIVIDEWRELNRWATTAVSEHPGRIACLVGLDPVLMPDSLIVEEVATRLAAGACGLKIAPMFLGVRPDDEVVEIVWRQAREHGVFVLSECGGHSFGTHQAWGHPDHFDAVLRAYPEVTVQLAHLGQGAEMQVAELTERYRNVVTDTSLRLGANESPEDLVSVMRVIGIDRVLFGTNYPLVDPADYVAALRALPLTDDELHQVAGANAERTLGVTAQRG